ncbi:sugar O-acyltransferase (sialic acid O-acetyltransferase NeuD family) [Mesonia hippocampi]|uniref:Sugar O-acyltransferase (Sialic acid O-acetyltransferase NeuD family) n=1 Tax=Mesonia hippocampi TaxID=1628250 RepID=A0A840ET07_9FLAO|nr:acetyltransferase [Mesonia hippocampi]MBB4120090.1 sugar O-acyltransferase (sialic acid O-acetyltransferase NeuD family) [Mesonia hippocampi]
MVKKIVIIGAGGFGREVKVLIDQLNQERNLYEIEGFYDDAENLPEIINGLPLLGKIDNLLEREENIEVAIGIGIPEIKKQIISRFKGRCNFNFPVLIHPSVYIGDDVKIGRGSIICAGNIITCNINIGAFVTLNLSCTTGHDTLISNYCSFMPSVNISGEVQISENVYVGTGAKIINLLSIGENTVIGAGAVVAKSLPSNCTAVGIPAKPIRYNKTEN